MASGVVILLCGWVLASCRGSNLDVEEPIVFREDAASFGQTVVQFGVSRLVVGAPLEAVAVNQTGRLYDCAPATGMCQPIVLSSPLEAVNMSLGLSLVTATNNAQLLACGPTAQRACVKNMYAKGSCLLLGSSLQFIQAVPPSMPECPRQEMDIAFLIDGSGSIDPKDFAQMKDFVKALMGEFASTSTLFSLMQYSNILKTHFTFTEFKNILDPQSLVDPIVQLKGLTYTATGIRRVVEELFHSKNGSRKSAKKILVVITDGQKYRDPLEYNDVIPAADKAGIIRYAIGVGDAFQEPTALKELNTIGSAPPQDHVFKVGNFAALRSIQRQLQEKIFTIEGTQSRSSSSFQHEMSQEGFSSALTTDGPVLGAVGSFSWSGGAFLYPPSMRPTFINMSQENVDMRDSYLGYSTEVAFWKGVHSLILGAPRHQHTGKVVIFTQKARHWRPKSEVRGTQIGSYFGASLCSVDVDRDGSTDLVLIGAPHYYEQTRGGQVSVCPMPGVGSRWQCEATLHGEQGHPWGRFGAALTVLGDVNGDDLADVAIGAPGEEESRGAVYIFHGASRLEISPSPSQRISASRIFSTLQYFGQSLSGGQDLTRDGLVDLAVGSKGHVLLLRTRPILRMSSTIHFTPTEISRSVFECQEQVTREQRLGNATVCLRIYESSKTQRRDLQSIVTFDLALDPGRLSPRAIFEETKTQALTKVRTLGLSSHCEPVKLLLPACVEDSVTPITLRLNFSLVGVPIRSLQNLQPMLAVDEQTYFTASLPFEKNCGADHICQDDLGIIFGFPDLKTLVVGSNLELSVAVTVTNDGEDSYGTTITLFYPVGLSFRRVAEAQVFLRTEDTQQWQQYGRHSLHLMCDSTPDRSQGIWSTSCSSRHVIFRGGSQMTFLVTFDVSPKAELGDRLLLRARVSSENGVPETSKTTFQLELPVKYAVYTVISSHDQFTKYLNFSASEKSRVSVVEHRFQVNNLGQRDLPVSINFWVPTELKGETVWTVMVSHPQNPSTLCYQNRLKPTQFDFLTHMQKSPVLDCSIADCLHFRCDIPSLGIQDELDFIVRGNLSFGWISQTLQKKVLLVSEAEISFDTSVYSQLPGQEAFLRAQAKTTLEMYEVHNPVPLIVGSSVGGLLLLALITAVLYKAGFFKRQYKEMLAEANGQFASGNGNPNSQVTQQELPSPSSSNLPS